MSSRLLVMLPAILHHYLFSVLEVLLIARPFMPHECITWCKTFLMATLLLVIMHTFYQAILLFLTVVRTSRMFPKMHFFLSQLWIRIEQAFGLLVAKWRIFKKPLDVKFWRTTLIIEAAFHLHNFCIDARESSILNHGNCDPQTFSPTYMEYLDPLSDNITLKAILQKIKTDGQKRPRYNIIRNSINTVG